MPSSRAMPALLELQRAFARALAEEGDRAICAHIVEHGIAAAERLRIYRNTCRATLVQSLRLTYPAVERIVGCEFFDLAAERYAGAHPARSGYLNDYGGGFAAFLAGFPPARELAYLPDVARFEWALGTAANAPDAPALAPEALLAVPVQAHAPLRFEPHPSVSCLELAFAADEIADAVLAGDAAAMGQIDVSRRPVRLVVHRGPNGVEAERLTAPAYQFVSRLCAGEPLARVIEAAPVQAGSLLAEQLAKGRLSACRTPR
jgi:hypothetical protein